LLQEAAPVTFSAIAKRIGISRISLWRFRLRWPGLDGWVSEHLAASNAKRVEPLLTRMLEFGMRGSEAHAALFLKYAGPPPTTRDTEPGGTTVINNHGPSIVNVAVPRPGDTPVSSAVEAKA